MHEMIIGLDIGGANLKAATVQGCKHPRAHSNSGKLPINWAA